MLNQKNTMSVSICGRSEQPFARTITKKIVIAFAVSAICVTSSFAEFAKRTTGQSFALDDKSLPDGREMTYICVRGSVCDKLIDEIPPRDYGQRGLPVEGAIVWLKRNPRCQAFTNASGVFEIIVENGILSKSKNPKDDIDMVIIPKGNFDMGSCLPGGKCVPMQNKIYTGYDERPEHTVYLSEFKIAKNIRSSNE